MTLIERQVIGAQGLEAATREQRWEADYRQAVIRELDHVDLFGADLPAEAKRNLLTDAFVTLNINQKVKYRAVRADNLELREPTALAAGRRADDAAKHNCVASQDRPDAQGRPDAQDMPDAHDRPDASAFGSEGEAGSDDTEYIGLLSSEAVFDQLGLAEKKGSPVDSRLCWHEQDHAHAVGDNQCGRAIVQGRSTPSLRKLVKIS